MSSVMTSQPFTAQIPKVHVTPFLPRGGGLSLWAFFILSGAMKFVGWEATATHMQQHGLPMVSVLLPIAATAELAGGLALLLGCLSRPAALGLILFLIPTTLVFHNFWAQSGMEAQNNMAHFLKNIAIMGGLLFVMAFGPGPLSIDEWRSKEPARKK